MEQRTDGTSRYHERREEKKRDKRGRGRGGGRDLDFPSKTWHLEPRRRTDSSIPLVCWHRVVESASSDGDGFLRLVALLCILLLARGGALCGFDLVWSGLVSGSGWGMRSEDGIDPTRRQQEGWEQRWGRISVCLSLGPTVNQPRHQRRGISWCIVDIQAHHGMIWQLP